MVWLLVGGAAARARLYTLFGEQDRTVKNNPFSPRCSSVRLLSGGWRGRWKWFGIPLSAGLACLAMLQLERTLRREARRERRWEGVEDTWQVGRRCGK